MCTDDSENDLKLSFISKESEEGGRRGWMHSDSDSNNNSLDSIVKVIDSEGFVR